MFEALIALGLSLAQSFGGNTGALAAQVFNTASSLLGATDEVKATLTLWIAYANKIVDEKRNPTAEEGQAINEFADAVRAQNHALATGTAFADLPPLPAPPAA